MPYSLFPTSANTTVYKIMITPSESMESSSSTSISSLAPSQRQQRHTSLRQQTTSIDPSASPPFSIDQLSILARRASSSSITISALTQPFQYQRLPDEQERQKKIYDAARKGIIYTVVFLLLSQETGFLYLYFLYLIII